MKTVFITKGLPASGKSTRAKQKQKEMGNCKRVNKDDLRAMLDDSRWSKGNEIFVLAVRDSIVTEALKNGQHVIVDDTNFEPKHEERLREIAKSQGAVVKVIEFNTPLDECIERDLKRPNSVGEHVIRGMYNKYLKRQEPIVQDPANVKAIIVDIDGTLAHMNGRGPYDRDKVGDDTVDPQISNIVGILSARYKILLCSGRDGICKEQTEEWLKRHQIQYDLLCMRTHGDNRQDAIVKREMLNELVNHYYIDFVLDDRNQVVQIWRDVGINCLQVADGDF